MQDSAHPQPVPGWVLAGLLGDIAGSVGPGQSHQSHQQAASTSVRCFHTAMEHAPTRSLHGHLSHPPQGQPMNPQNPVRVSAWRGGSVVRPVRGDLGRMHGRLGPLAAALGDPLRPQNPARVSASRSGRVVRPVRGDLGRVRGRLGPLAAARALVHRQLGLQEVHAEDGRDLGAPGRQGLIP